MIEQIALGLTGGTAIWLSQDARLSVRKWACIFGLAGQPCQLAAGAPGTSSHLQQIVAKRHFEIRDP